MGHALTVDSEVCMGHDEDISGKLGLEAILASLSVPTFVLDAEHRVIAWNRACEVLTGVKAEDVIGTREAWRGFYPAPRPCLADIVIDQELQRMTELYLKVGEAKFSQGLHAENWFDNLSGRRRYLIIDAEPVYDAGGKLIAAIESLEDITEIKNAEAELQHFEAMVQSSDDAIISKDLDGIVTSWNRGAEKIFGYTADEMIGKPIRMLLPSDRQGEEDVILAQIRQGAKIEHFETVRVCKFGAPVDVSVTISPIFDPSGKVVGASKIARDITERMRTEQELRIAATAFETQEGILITAADQTILRVNRAFTEITGYTAQEAIGQRPSMLKSGRHDDAFYRAIYASLATTGRWQGDIWDRHKDGHIYPKSLSITVVKDSSDQVTHYVATFADISQRVAAEEKIRNLAFYDALTQLPNRRLLLDRLEQALLASVRGHHYGALLFLDLDKFKALNDSKGHRYGDMLLIEVAHRLKDCVREEDTVARLGGDEFVVMLENLDEDQSHAAVKAKTVGDKIVAALNQPYVLGEHKHDSSTSVGVTLFHGKDSQSDALISQADTAMYEAKKAGRNTLRFFDPAMQQALDARSVFEAALRKALPGKQFSLHYQVQVNMEGVPIGAEALIRWMHPERGLVSPVEFIPLAEEINLIQPIGEWVLETACAQLAAWKDQPLFKDLTVSVNVSSRQFKLPDFVETVQSIVRRYDIRPERLELELTESMVIHDLEDAIAKMHLLKEMGFCLSLDDFGTGYSSLSYLRRLPFDQIKVDRSFVTSVAADSNDAFIVLMVTTMGRMLGMDVIAEGVETEEQKELLENLGCRAFQGYLFGKPMPVEAFESLIHGLPQAA